MRALTELELLEVWEAAVASTPTRRALLLLERAMPLLDLQQLASMPLGWRAARLLELRTLQFGVKLHCLAECPHCRATIECAPSADELREGAIDETTASQRFTFMSHGVKLEFRLPCSEDMLAVEAHPSQGVQTLVERLVVSSGDTAGMESLAPDVRADLELAIEAHDPHARIELDLVCPDCLRASRSLFDPVAFLWREIDAAARRLMLEIARLAASFGWSEAEVLAVHPTRRARYLAMVGP